MGKEEWSLVGSYWQAFRRRSCLCSETGSLLERSPDSSPPWLQWPFLQTGEQILGLLATYFSSWATPCVEQSLTTPTWPTSTWEKTKCEILWFLHPRWICRVFYLVSPTNSINPESLVLSWSHKSKVIIYKPYMPHKHGIDCCCPPRVILAFSSQPPSLTFTCVHITEF